MLDQKLLTRSDAIAKAELIVRTRYEGAAFAYAAGSILRGEGTYLSDIDLVVIYDRLDAARRESFLSADTPVEAFVHDPETLEWFMASDVRRGRPSILNMIAEGTIVGRDVGRARTLQLSVSNRLANGPPPLQSAALNSLRYEITDAVDDLRGHRAESEMMAIGIHLYPKLVELALRGRGQWNGTGKWSVRMLARTDPSLAARFDDAFRALFVVGDASRLLSLAEAELGPLGGFLFDGDCRTAPANWRN